MSELGGLPPGLSSESPELDFEPPELDSESGLPPKLDSEVPELGSESPELGSESPKLDSGPLELGPGSVHFQPFPFGLGPLSKLHSGLPYPPHPGSKADPKGFLHQGDLLGRGGGFFLLSMNN